MTWNWQKEDWPNFTYDAEALNGSEETFLLQSGEFNGAFRHVDADDQDVLRIELISDEALKTSEIEGELLNRDSVQSSLRQQMGLGGEAKRIPPRERGIAEMMVDLYESFGKPLTHKRLYGWHKMVMAGGRDIDTIGDYRHHVDAMQIVSGAVGKQKVHFEAPPSSQVKTEMRSFIGWFNDSGPGGKAALPPLTRASIAHLYYESIHPFEDGNGRIGRALSEKALAQYLGQPSLIALAYTIQRKRNAYYEALEASNKDNEITGWLIWFANTILEAQQTTMKRVEFHIAKTRLYDRSRGRFNARQEKVIARMFREGIDGFKGGLSADNYISITGAPRATTTRDLQDLVAKGALTRTGERRYTRYWLRLGTTTD